MQSCSGGTLIKGECAAEPEEGLFPAFSASGQDVWIERPDYSSPGIVLSAVGARCGKTFKADGEWGVVANTHCLFPGDSENRDYFWYLTNKEDWWEIGGTAQPFVKVKETLSRSWCLPPANEQRAIATFLDQETAKIDALIAEQERLIELLQEKRQAVISHAVTKGLNPNAPMKDSGVEWLGEVPEHWPITPLKYVVKMKSGGTPPKAKHGFWDGGDIPWASSKDLKSEILKDTQDHITEKAIFEGVAQLQQKESVFICVRGMILSHTFPVSEPTRPMAINQDLKSLVPLENLDLGYLAVLLRGLSNEILGRVDEAAHGTKVLRIPDFSSLMIPVPPKEEQVSIREEVENSNKRHDSLINDTTKAMHLLRERRSALISAAVTGQIDVRSLLAEKTTV